MIASCELYSEHPLGKAIVSSFKETYNKENEEKFTWTLNTNDNYINIMLLKVGTMWEIIDDYRESLYVETKAKGYRAIRDIIKKYEKIALL